MDIDTAEIASMRRVCRQIGLRLWVTLTFVGAPLVLAACDDGTGREVDRQRDGAAPASGGLEAGNEPSTMRDGGFPDSASGSISNSPDDGSNDGARPDSQSSVKDGSTEGATASNGADGAQDAAGTCSDGERNQDETDVDCGGACAGCADGSSCALASDCASGVCASGTCQVPTCADGIQNGSETGVDCGDVCGACAGSVCATGADCVSGVCVNALCEASTCFDGVQNGAETNIDCGGTCGLCSGAMCNDASECASGVCSCVNMVYYSGSLWCADPYFTCFAPSCYDAVRNGTETDVDCGGPCSGCAVGKGCRTANDCLSDRCDNGVCRNSCLDGTLDGTESDVDCGGDFCAPCSDGGACSAAADCASGVCTNGMCQAPTCNDGVRNGVGAAAESDVDCGGTVCDPCLPGKNCITRSDCTSRSCTLGTYGYTCAWASCTDGVQNAYESDPDCGGSTCPQCDVGRHCRSADDCVSTICTNGLCAAAGPTCTDGIRDGDEIDVDCGGSCVPCSAPSFTPFSYTPSNFDPGDPAIDPTVVEPMMVLDCGVSEFDSTTLHAYNWCGHPLPSAVVRVQPDGTEIAVVPLRGLHVAAGSTLRLYGTRPVILAVYGDAVIDGAVDASAHKDSFSDYDYPGAGGRFCPEGPGGGGGSGSPAGSVDSTAPAGAGAGHATAGIPGWNNDNVGMPFGTPDAVPLLGACQGGNGGDLYSSSYGYVPGGRGGFAGGAVQLSASATLQVAGVVNTSGGAGRGSSVYTDYVVSDCGPRPAPCLVTMVSGVSSGGGGSGGSVLLEGSAVQVLPTASLNAQAGLGAVDSVFDTAYGGDGSAGIVHINGQSCWLSGTSSPLATRSCAAACDDGVQDGTETGIDCGGGVCPACP